MFRTALLAITFVVFTGLASLGVYGAAVAPGAAAFDGYDHSFETANVTRGDAEVQAGY